MTLGILPYMLREGTIVYYINTIDTDLAPVYIYVCIYIYIYILCIPNGSSLYIIEVYAKDTLNIAILVLRWVSQGA